MWEMVSNMIPMANRMMPGRRNRGMNTATAMLIGAAVGIATWEVVRRTTPMGNLRGVNDKALSDMAEEVMDAIQ
ncbi:hypothetical protein [Effusibacillus pohliae]|uniref:hypothetical protein n=1 Tax=Effusibacillus pohliae TaxID=232270 RepID=UPI000375CC9A|nr:hypothetical protein [Effusibacillus pohliae]